ncbi:MULTISPECIES: hypothetical protein [Giesbergeria]|uniref:Transmembrane protein n=1 Tax=Giesbergeria sinuosa TaxID=80883 RepID=A0ABV9QHV8_9BURK
MTHKQKDLPIQRDWLSKTLAGIVWGVVLGLAGSGWFSYLHPDMPLAVRGQLAMWMFAPIALGVLAGVYFFSSGIRAWCWLGSVALLASGTLALWRLF